VRTAAEGAGMPKAADEAGAPVGNAFDMSAPTAGCATNDGRPATLPPKLKEAGTDAGAGNSVAAAGSEAAAVALPNVTAGSDGAAEAACGP